MNKSHLLNVAGAVCQPPNCQLTTEFSQSWSSHGFPRLVFAVSWISSHVPLWFSLPPTQCDYFSKTLRITYLKTENKGRTVIITSTTKPSLIKCLNTGRLEKIFLFPP